VANYPGFPEGISGPDLVNNMKEQASQFGADLEHGIVVDVDDSDRPFRVEVNDGTVYTCDAFLAASRCARTLGVPGEDDLMGYGISTCATCDGAFFRDEDMLVVGGGDAAMEEASLTKFADTVYVVHRRDEFRAEDYWVERVDEHVENDDIEVLRNTELLEVEGSAEDGVDQVVLAEHPRGPPDRQTRPRRDRDLRVRRRRRLPAIGHTRTPTTSRGPASNSTTRATSGRQAVTAATRPPPTSRESSALATSSTSTTSRPSPRAGWAARPPSMPTSTWRAKTRPGRPLRSRRPRQTTDRCPDASVRRRCSQYPQALYREPRIDSMATDTVTLTVESEEDTDELELPRELVDMLRESDDETAPEVVGDIAMMGFAQRIHGAAHHAEGEPDQQIADLNDLTMNLFEDRFGATFGELTGHDH